MNYFTHLKTRYEKELEGNVIPFWTAHGIDREYGGFFSYLERDGAIYDTRKPLWMQWRAVYMFAALYNSPFRKEEYLDAAVNGFDFLLKHGRTANGSYGFMLDRRGKMLQEKAGGAELFSDSFAAIAAAELFIAAGDDRYEKESFRPYVYPPAVSVCGHVPVRCLFRAAAGGPDKSHQYLSGVYRHWLNI